MKAPDASPSDPGTIPPSGDGVTETKKDPQADGLWSKVGEFIKNVGSPLALITALMFYFGWVRTHVQARELGYDVAVLQLSTTDALLKSINVLFPIVALALILVLIGYGAYSWCIHRIADSDRPEVRAKRAYVAAGVGAIGAAVGGAICLAFDATRLAAIPVSLTVILLFVFFRDRLRPFIKQPRWNKTRRAIALILLSLLLFWDTERIAVFLGEQYAEDIKACPDQFAQTVVYSQLPLDIDAEGVGTKLLGVAGEPSRFRYTGLRLMEQIGDRYVLINEVWHQGQGRVMVVVQSDTLRFEFIEREQDACKR